MKMRRGMVFANIAIIIPKNLLISGILIYYFYVSQKYKKNMDEAKSHRGI
jgi:hypothetical protein